MCLSETYLDSSILNDDDDNLQNLLQNFSSTKNKKHYLQECINFEIKIKDNLRNFISLY